MEAFLIVVGVFFAIVILFSIGKSRLDAENSETVLTDALKQSGITENEDAVFRFNCYVSSFRRQNGHITSSKSFGESKVLVYENKIILVTLGAWRAISISAIAQVNLLMPDIPVTPQIMNLNLAGVVANAVARAEVQKIVPNISVEFLVNNGPYDDYFFRLDRFQTSFDPQSVVELINRKINNT